MTHRVAHRKINVLNKAKKVRSLGTPRPAFNLGGHSDQTTGLVRLISVNRH